jgi:sulfur-carrier protein
LTPCADVMAAFAATRLHWNQQAQKKTRMPATSAGMAGEGVPSGRDALRVPAQRNAMKETRSRERDKGARSMAKVVFTPNIQRHVALPEAEACGRTVRDVLEAVFADNPQARGYVLDDQSGLRKHMTIFVDGRMIRDRARLTDAVSESSTVYVFQALSGG